MTNEKLNQILEKHKMWLQGENNGERANLNNADLSHANLNNANLCGANLNNANLFGANLSCANFHDADLCGANLCSADLCGANLNNANLCGANLNNADLSHANFNNANLCGAYLSCADLCRANLNNADLSGAELDYSCLPLWRGSLFAYFDDRQLRQIAYHLVKAGLHSKNASEETKRELSKLIDFANRFHRAEEYGLIERRTK